MNYFSQSVRMMLRLSHVTRARDIARSECGGNNPGAKLLKGEAAHNLSAGSQLVIAPARIIVSLLGIGTAEEEVIESASGTSLLIWRREIFLNGKRNRIKPRRRNLVAGECCSNVVSGIARVGDSRCRIVDRQQGACAVKGLREVAGLLQRRGDAGGRSEERRVGKEDGT